MQTVTLNDSQVLPQLGLGLFASPRDQTAQVVRNAAARGYRLFDTATMYENEEGVGEGVRTSGMADQLIVTSKVWNDDHGYDNTLRAFDESMTRLRMDVLGLYLIHWPCPMNDLYLETWKALIQLKKDGRVKSIGVSNFAINHLQHLIDETGVVPTVNQVELHPRFAQAELRRFHARNGIVTQAWAPLGRGKTWENPVIAKVAAKHGKSPVQTIIRWHLDLGVLVIPKSVNPDRMAQNIDVFDFKLDAEDMAAIATLDVPLGRTGPEPSTSRPRAQPGDA